MAAHKRAVRRTRKRKSSKHHQDKNTKRHSPSDKNTPPDVDRFYPLDEVPLHVTEREHECLMHSKDVIQRRIKKRENDALKLLDKKQSPAVPNPVAPVAKSHASPLASCSPPFAGTATPIPVAHTVQSPDGGDTIIDLTSSVSPLQKSSTRTGKKTATVSFPSSPRRVVATSENLSGSGSDSERPAPCHSLPKFYSKNELLSFKSSIYAVIELTHHLHSTTRRWKIGSARRIAHDTMARERLQIREELMFMLSALQTNLDALLPRYTRDV